MYLSNYLTNQVSEQPSQVKSAAEQSRLHVYMHSPGRKILAL